MRSVRTIAIWCAGAMIAGSAANADPDVNATLTCPATAGVGTTIAMNVHLENRDCSPYNVRLLTAIAGNANQTLAGLGVYGPVVTTETTLPAATDHLPGTCSTPSGFGQCIGSSPPVTCFGHADCVCRQTTPAVVDFPALNAPPQVPAAHVGTVESHVMITEWKGAAGDATLVQQCLVEVLP